MRDCKIRMKSTDKIAVRELFRQRGVMSIGILSLVVIILYHALDMEHATFFCHSIIDLFVFIIKVIHEPIYAIAVSYLAGLVFYYFSTLRAKAQYCLCIYHDIIEILDEIYDEFVLISGRTIGAEWDKAPFSARAELYNSLIEKNVNCSPIGFQIKDDQYEQLLSLVTNTQSALLRLLNYSSCFDVEDIAIIQELRYSIIFKHLIEVKDANCPRVINLEPHKFVDGLICNMVLMGQLKNNFQKRYTK